MLKISHLKSCSWCSFIARMQGSAGTSGNTIHNGWAGCLSAPFDDCFQFIYLDWSAASLVRSEIVSDEQNICSSMKIFRSSSWLVTLRDKKGTRAILVLSCHIQMTASCSLTRLFAFASPSLPSGNDRRLICARRRADPRQLPFRTHSGASSAEKPDGGARGTLQAAGLRGEAPNSHHHSPQTQRTPPQVPAVLPASFSAATAAPVWNLCHSPGEMHTNKSGINSTAG